MLSQTKINTARRYTHNHSTRNDWDIDEMTEARLQKIHCSGRCTSNYRRNGALYGNGYKNTTEKEECTTKMIVNVRCLHQESTGGFNKKQPKETSVLADASHFKLFTYSHLVWSRGNMCDQVVF